MTRGFWDEVANGYDSVYTTEWSRLEDELVKRAIETNLPPQSQTLVDLGCGTGLVAGLLHARNDDMYIGLDHSAIMIRKAATKFPTKSFVVADLNSTLPFLDSTADVIISTFGTISYLLSPTSLFSEMHRVLKPGGTAVVMMLNRWALRRLARGSFARTEEYGTRGVRSSQPAVARLYSFREQRILLRSSGFHVKATFGCGLLAGLLETAVLWRLDRLFCTLCPGLSHMSILIAARV